MAEETTANGDLALPHAISLEYVTLLLGAKPDDPAATPIPPTNLLPQQLGASGWQPTEDTPGHVSSEARQAALSEAERKALLEQFEKRMRVLLDAWLHLPGTPAAPLVHLLESLANLPINHWLPQEKPVPYKAQP